MVFVFIFHFSLFFSIFSKNVRIETCETTPLQGTIFCDKSAEISERVEFLISQLTLYEKISMVDRYQPYLSRFNISYFNWRCEALHGLGHSTCEYDKFHVVSYPQVINLGRTFDMEKIEQMASQISDSANAFYNEGIFEGLSFWSPVINLIRDPRWGRLQENTGEDPFLLGEYSKAFIQGMMIGKDPKYYKTIPAAKHFTAYDLENWGGYSRHSFNAIVTEQDLEDTFNYPFKIAVEEAGVRQIMCSYNAINGVPACGNSYIMNTIAREGWNYQGFFVSDEGAISDICYRHQYVPNPEEAAVLGIKAGCDMNDGTMYRDNLAIAYDWGLFKEEELNQPIRNILTQRFMLGEFDSPLKDQYYRNIPIDVVNSDEHKDLSYRLALESIVLLKNENNVLPLDPLDESLTIGLIGPNCDITNTLLGSYFGPTDPPESPKSAIESKSKSTILFAKGCEDVSCETTLHFNQAKTVAENSDVVILFVGLDQHVEREGHDRESLLFPGHQGDLIKMVKENSKGPVICVLIKAGPIDISYEKEEIDAILDCGYPGQFGGRAIADVLFGDYSPSGRLTYTVYHEDYLENVRMTDMRMRANKDEGYPGRTYRFFDGPKIYEFGFGISYTEFHFQWMWNNEDIVMRMNESKIVACAVTNLGKVESDVIVLAFVGGIGGEPNNPLRRLFGIERFHLKPDDSHTVFFEVTKKIFEDVDIKGKRIVKPGNYFIQIEDLKKSIKLIK